MSTQPEPVPSGSATPVLACKAPPKAVLAWARSAIASHPGPVRDSTIVPAAKTLTGQWYVIAIDREFVLDNGTPTGDGSRSLGLTNAVNRHRAESKMIAIGEGRMGGTPMLTWQKVTWSGDELAAGERAAERAVQCLDEAAQQ